MKRKIPKNTHLNVFRTQLVNVINMNHELVILSQKIDWRKILEKEFLVYYPELGRLAVPIRSWLAAYYCSKYMTLTMRYSWHDGLKILIGPE